MTPTTAARRPLGALVARALSGSWRQSPPPLALSLEQLTEVVPLLLKSGCGALAWWRIHETPMTQHLLAAAELHDAFRMQVLNAAIQERQIAEVFALLRAAGVEPVLIKGWAAVRLYAHGGVRPCTDIDLCVDPGRLAAAQAVVCRPPGSRYPVDLTHSEVTDVAGLIARSGLVPLGGAQVRIPCPEDHLRLLCIHALKHAVCRPQWLCDIAAAVERRPATFSWQGLLGGNRRHAGWIASAIGLAHLLLGADVAGTPVETAARHLPRWLVRSVLAVWSNPDTFRLVPREFAATSVHSLAVGLRDRWANPIQSSIMMNAAINGFPRLPIQVALYGQRVVKFLRHPPGAPLHPGGRPLEDVEQRRS